MRWTPISMAQAQFGCCSCYSCGHRNHPQPPPVACLSRDSGWNRVPSPLALDLILVDLEFRASGMATVQIGHQHGPCRRRGAWPVSFPSLSLNLSSPLAVVIIGWWRRHSACAGTRVALLSPSPPLLPLCPLLSGSSMVWVARLGFGEPPLSCFLP